MDVRYTYAFVALFASTVLLVAIGCGGGDDDTDGGTTAPAAAAPTSAAAAAAPAVAVAPAAKPTPTQRTATGARPTPTLVASFAAVTPWYNTGRYNVGTAAGTAVLRGELLRTLVGLYFDALNANDLNLLLPLLDETYRNDNEAAIRDQLDELDAAGATLTWIEEQAPGLTGPTSMVMFVSVEAPSGTERWQIQFTELGRNTGNWVISGAGPEG